MKLLALDIGGSAVKYGTVDSFGTVFDHGSFPTPSTLEELLKHMQDVHALYPCSACAISAPGSVNSDTGVIGGISAVPYLHGPDIRTLISRQLGIPAEIENDANCAALAELWLGEAQDIQDACVVIIGTGIGGALIKNRSIHSGHTRSAGEFGLMITDRDLHTGAYHVWSYHSTIKTVARAEKEAGLPAGSLNGEILFQQAESNPIFRKHVSEFCHAVAVGLLNLQQIYDPELILIGGGISAQPGLLEQIEAAVDETIGDHAGIFVKPNLRICRFRSQANLIGAVFHYLRKQELL